MKGIVVAQHGGDCAKRHGGIGEKLLRRLQADAGDEALGAVPQRAVAEVAQGPLLDVQLLADGGDGDGCKVFADIVLGAQQRFGNRSALAHVLPQKHQRREKQALGDIPAPLLGADEAVLKQALDEIARADAKHAVLLQ